MGWSYVACGLSNQSLANKGFKDVLTLFSITLKDSILLYSLCFWMYLLCLLSSPTKLRLSPKSIRCIYLGFGETQRGFRCYDPISKRIRVSQNVTFMKLVPIFSSSSSQGRSTSDPTSNGLTWFPDFHKCLVYFLLICRSLYSHIRDRRKFLLLPFSLQLPM